MRPIDIELDETAGDVDALRRLAASLKRGSPEETLKAVHERVWKVRSEDAWTSPYRRRMTSSEMLESPCVWGCSAYSQMACHLARACGIPAMLVKSLNCDWIEQGNRNGGRADGHVYVEVLIDGAVYLGDAAETGEHKKDYTPQTREVQSNRGPRLIYDKGGPNEVILSHHGTDWEAEVMRRFPPVRA